REQRFRTAAEMRRALNGTDQATTVSSRSEADTVLFPPASAPSPNVAPSTAVAGQQTVPKPVTHALNESTVVRAAVVARKRRFPAWAIAAIVLAVIGVGAGAFYAFRQRQAPPAATQISVAPENNLKPAASPSVQAQQPEQKAATDELKAAAEEE